MSRQAKFPPEIQSGVLLGNIPEIVAKSYPNHEALVVDNIRKTWSQYAEDVDRLAIELINLGISKKDIVSIWARNNYDWMVAWFGIARVGAILVPLDHWYRDEDAFYILNHSEAKAVICTKEFLPLINQMAHLTHLKYIILMSTKMKKSLLNFSRKM